jgi:hypothetical protein
MVASLIVTGFGKFRGAFGSMTVFKTLVMCHCCLLLDVRAAYPA